MKQLEVQIMGQSYLLGCPEGGEARLLQAVLKVDAAMCKIRDAGKIKARDRIAVLAALNLAFEIGEQPAAAETPSPAASEVQASGSETALTSADSAQVVGLLSRLDAALGNDGHLL